MFLARADAPASTFIKGYWTHLLTDYPSCEWKDDDGTNSDVIGYTGSDKDRPFVFSQGSNFRLDTADFKPYSAGTLTGSWSVSSNKHAFSSGGTLPSADNEGKYHVSFSGVNGSALDTINSETVTLNWSVAGESFRTKHKVYTIGGTLNNDNKYHTLIDIGCEAAKGLSNTQKDEIVNKVWSAYATRRIYRIDDVNHTTSLKYWGATCVGLASLTDEHGNSLEPRTIGALLALGDADCYAWGNAFLETLRLQGVTDDPNGVRLRGFVIRRDTSVPVYIDNEEYTIFTFLQNTNVVQGDDDNNLGNQFPGFTNHYLVQYGNDIYDVGTGIKYSSSDFNSTLSYYIQNALKVRVKKNNVIYNTWIPASSVGNICNAIQPVYNQNSN